MKNDIVKLVKGFGLYAGETENEVILDFTTKVIVEGEKISLECDGEVWESLNYIQLYNRIKKLYF